MNVQIKRDILTVAHLRKLEEEIDMLRKQKIYLQSKLREKNGEKKPKKPKNKTWIVEGYYYDGKNAYTYVRDPETLKGKRIKGIA